MKNSFKNVIIKKIDRHYDRKPNSAINCNSKCASDLICTLRTNLNYPNS